uniref:Uncharacterized protein n=1 Tax=Acanthochromis polyacanthus TaxID=80966 RepID=A0A3Q1I1Y0_9TELE
MDSIQKKILPCWHACLKLQKLGRTGILQHDNDPERKKVKAMSWPGMSPDWPRICATVVSSVQKRIEFVIKNINRHIRS